MKQLIARLRELHTDWEKYEKREPHEPQPYSDQIAEALPQLLDRLEKLERAVEAGRMVVVSDYAFTMADSYGLQLIRDLKATIAALEDK